MFGFEILLFSKPSLLTAALGILLAGVFPCAGEKQVRGTVSSGGAETRSSCGSFWKVYRLPGDGFRGAVCTLCLDEGFEKPSTNNCNFLFALW